MDATVRSSYVLCLVLAAASLILAAPSVEARGPKVTYAPAPEVIAMFTKIGRPQYPYEARRARASGSGVFRMYINPDGSVRAVGVMKSTGNKVLGLAAAGGLYQWRAKPGGNREVDMPITFTLGGR